MHAKRLLCCSRSGRTWLHNRSLPCSSKFGALRLLFRQHIVSHDFTQRMIATQGITTPQAPTEAHGPSEIPSADVAVLGQVVAAQANYVRVRVDALVSADGVERHVAHSAWAAGARDPQTPTEDASPSAELHAAGPWDPSQDVHRPTGGERPSQETQAAGPLNRSQLPASELLCTVRALLKKMKQTVLVGDRVRVNSIDWLEARGVVESVFPRGSELTDPSVANVDHALLVFTFALPPFEPPNVTRYLVAAEATELPLTVVLNKADVVTEEAVEAVLEEVRSWGYDAVPVSTVTGQGIPELAQLLRNRVAVLAGPSGVGKSSIINSLRLLAARSQQQPQQDTYSAAQPSWQWQRLRGLPDSGHDAEVSTDSTSQPGAGQLGGDRVVQGHAALVGGVSHAGVAADCTPMPSATDPHATSRGVGVGHTSDGIPSRAKRAGLDMVYHSSTGAAVSENSDGIAMAATECIGNAAAVWEAAAGGDAAGQMALLEADSPESCREELEWREAQALGLDLQDTGDLSQIGRGKHTTRNVMLLEMEGGGLLADTPGFNQPDLTMEPHELPALFPEIRQRLEEASCAFSNCRHLDEPGCAVRGGWQRYDYYVALREELQERYDLLKTRASSKKKRQGNIRYKTRAGGQMAAEVRLDPKKHRRLSRKNAKQQLGSMLGGTEEVDEDL